MNDKFLDDLENEINRAPKNVEPVAFSEWEERGLLGNHTKERKLPKCYHSKKTLDEDCRMVQCDECEAYLDPFDTLYRLVRDRELKQRHSKNLNKEIDELASKVYELKKELKSLGGKIKRRRNHGRIKDRI